MSRRSEATQEDWAAIRSAWESGASLAACSKAVEGRAAPSTIRRRADLEAWVRHDGTKQILPLETRKAMTKAASEARRAVWAEERERIVARLIEVTDDALDDMKRPVVAKEVKVLTDGHTKTQSVEVVEVHYETAPIAERKSLMWIAQTAVDRLQLLTGEATSRNEQIAAGDRGAAVARAKELRDEVAAKREQKAAAGGTG